VAPAAIRGEQTLVELSQRFDVPANQIQPRKDQLFEWATGVFGDEANGFGSSGPEIRKIYVCPARRSQPVVATSARAVSLGTREHGR
jgi:hypothetical protein